MFNSISGFPQFGREECKPFLTKKLYYNSALLSICFMIFLGWTDDILDLRWRYKMVLPTIASLPLLMVYSGTTNVLIPKFLQANLGRIIEIGKSCVNQAFFLRFT